jgi:hypothetical protein
MVIRANTTIITGKKEICSLSDNVGFSFENSSSLASSRPVVGKKHSVGSQLLDNRIISPNPEQTNEN